MKNLLVSRLAEARSLRQAETIAALEARIASLEARLHRLEQGEAPETLTEAVEGTQSIDKIKAAV